MPCARDGLSLGRNRHDGSSVATSMKDPDHPALQDECARRLLAYAAELSAKQQRQAGSPPLSTNPKVRARTR
jgi:hypothetical protein